MSKKIMNTDEFITLLAKRGRFTKSDTKIFFNELVDILKESVRDGVTIKLYGFGKLFTTIIPERKGKDGQILPPAKKVIFRLADGIRNAHKKDGE